MKISVLETNVLHASDVVYWLDGTTGTGDAVASMERVDGIMSVTFDERPKDLNALQKPGQMGLWRRPSAPVVEGLADESERRRTSEPTYQVTGVVEDVRGLYNPGRFELTVGNGAGHAMVMYPSPKGTRLGRTGALVGTLRFEQSGNPAVWALLKLEVTTAPSSQMRLHAQADRNGDFVLALRRLPPLSENVESYDAKLSVRASITASGSEPLAPGQLVQMQLGKPDEADVYLEAIDVSVDPGEVLHLKSFAKDYLAVKPV